jgi:A118 family predicted phage portal protein
LFERLKKVVKGWMQTTGADLGLATEFKDIFSLGGVPAYREFYNAGIFPWKYLYKGFYKPWHLVNTPTIQDEHATRNLFYLNLSKAVCSELAGMVWTDQSDITVSTNGADQEDDPLDKFVKKVLADNNFGVKMLEAIEQAAALGGEAMKVWREVRRDSSGNEVPGSEQLRIGWAMADQFVPTAWNNAEITEGVFISRMAKGGYYYTRLEWHKWDGLTYYITNELYRADMYRGGNTQEPQDILGMRVPLATIYPLMDEETTISGVDASLFTYFRTPTANNIDDNSPLGVSIYANAMETLHALDICFDSFVREFRLGKKRIIVPARMVKTVVDPQTGALRRYFDATDETYEALSTDDPDSLKIQDNSVALRVEEHVSAMNAFLNIFCLQVGLSAGTFSFDTQNHGIKTATEVVSENSKTYKTVRNFQNMIRPSIIRLVDNIISVAALYDMQTEDGQSVAQLRERGYEVNIAMDDGITQDRQTNINEGITLVGAGLISKKTFLTDPKYGQGLTDEAADAELREIANEQSVNTLTLDRINLGTAE